MTQPELETTSNPGAVWRVGFEPDMWAWTPWAYATDSGLFDGRWDDQQGEFRTLYTANSLLGCFLELLARFRPSATTLSALDDIEDDDGTLATYPDALTGTVGHSWLANRVYATASQDGRYCFITHSRSLGALQSEYPFDTHHISPADVDAALLKGARNRTLTRSLARWIYDLRADQGGELVDGIEFRSRYGDEIKMWAVFERSKDDTHSSHLYPGEAPTSVADDMPELLEAFDLHGLSWAD
ncbi:RES domain-containing protein [Subtercola vilae]|uniref:RES domain-containing protein n=1 Tax=Subtercola vilae TaxID=2056433 RepID=A0A4V4RF80_9MICO|nr:RES domain-containing protein [Subtercola vilae]TIH30794.1 RES domain-containing protein [Subtercola vilae]